MTGTVVIRFDVSSSIGTGHLRRAIALGDELVKRQISHYFVTPNESVTSAIELGVQERNLVGFSTELGEKDWIQRIPNLTHVITDFCHHERLNSGSAINEILQSKRLNVAVIDSMPPNHFQGDNDTVPSIVVSPYLDAESLREPPTCNNWVAGVQYAILDSNYLNIRQSLNRESVTAGNYILVCCGGSDPNQMSEYILQVLLQNKVPKVNVKIVVGNLFEKKPNRITQENSKSKPKIHFVGFQPEQYCRFDFQLWSTCWGGWFDPIRVSLPRQTQFLDSESQQLRKLFTQFSQGRAGKYFLYSKSKRTN